MLDQWLAWHRQLIALAAAGAPIDLGAGEPIERTLQRAVAIVSPRLHSGEQNRGETLADAIAAERSNLPSAYAAAAALGVATGDFSRATDEYLLPTPAAAPLEQLGRRALGYPLVVMTFAYLGFLFWLWKLAPELSAQYADLRIAPQGWLAWLMQLRQTWQFWIAIPPVLMFFGWLLRKPIARFFASRLPLVRATERYADYAALADDSAERLAAGQPLPARSAPPQADPALLQWALSDAVPLAERPAALALAANSFRQVVERRAIWLRRWAPLVACVVLAGGATLLYGLAVFVPVIDLLATLAKP
jgi:type II secretory pathway component PulF